MVPVPVGHAEIELAIDLGYLPIERSEDRRAIGAAVGEMVHDAAKHYRPWEQ